MTSNLFQAAGNNQIEVVKQLISSGTDVNQQDSVS